MQWLVAIGTGSIGIATMPSSSGYSTQANTSSDAALRRCRRAYGGVTNVDVVTKPVYCRWGVPKKLLVGGDFLYSRSRFDIDRGIYTNVGGGTSLHVVGVSGYKGVHI